MSFLGIDIGGSSVKFGWLQDEIKNTATKSGSKVTPPSSELQLLIGVVEKVAKQRFVQKVGIAFPAVIRDGVVVSTPHLDAPWRGVPAEKLFREAIECDVVLLNDADAALLAERQWGVCRDFKGKVLMLTLGTGIGSGLMVDGHVWRNSELGHLHLARGCEAESWAAAATRTRENLTWRQWADRLNEVLTEMVRLCHPDLIVLGGGISADFQHFSQYLSVDSLVKPSFLGNKAGFMGAALAAMGLEES